MNAEKRGFFLFISEISVYQRPELGLYSREKSITTESTEILKSFFSVVKMCKVRG